MTTALTEPVIAHDVADSPMAIAVDLDNNMEDVVDDDGNPVQGDPSILDDADSAYGSSMHLSDTTTLGSSIMRYRVENGRTYHSYGSTEYWGPNDEKARDQLDLSHHFWTLLLEGRYYTAPIRKPHKILDIGTGTGIWVIDVAESIPGADVKGIDLSPIQPIWVPPNVRFEIDDFNLDWQHEEKYDLVHMREIPGCVPDWVAHFKKCFKSLRPGGWVDCCEPGLFASHYVNLDETHPYRLWHKIFAEVGRRTGMPFHVAQHLKKWMEEAGFVNVRQHKVRCAIGNWPKDRRQKVLGLWNQVRLDTGVRDFSERVLRNVLHWRNEEISIFIAQVRAAVNNPRLCAHQDIYFVSGQKPPLAVS